MNAEQYRKEIYPEIITRYSYQEGLLAICKVSDGTIGLRICVPVADNPQFPWAPNKCFIWSRGNLLYEGDLRNAAKISYFGNKLKVCKILYTTVDGIERNMRPYPTYVCSPEALNKCRKKCPHRLEHLERKKKEEAEKNARSKVQEETQQR